VRTVAIVAALLLVVVAAGSGSAARTSAARTQAAGIAQNAIEAPRPSGVAKKKGGVVEEVACATAKSCAATGQWLYTEQAAKWKAAKVPVLAHTSGTNVRSLACPAAGACEAVGIAGEQHVLGLTEAGRQWRSAGVSVPDDAAPIDPPSGPWPWLGSVSCASAGNCVAVGHYGAADRSTRALSASESGGAWSAGKEVPLPSDASTTFPPPDSEAIAGGLLDLASCPSAASCTTVGSYTRKDKNGGTGGTYPWEFDETGGSWASGGLGLQLPAGAATTVDYRGGGASPFLGFSGLSCPSAGNCTAIGGYVDDHSNFQGAIFEERDGQWSNGIEAPAPRNATPNNDPMQLLNPLVAVSCAAPDDCAAVGWFVVGHSETQHGLLLTDRSGHWRATGLVLPRGARAPGGVFPTSVSCASSGHCVAVGYYAGHGKTHGLIVRERNGRWERAANASVPANAAAASKSHTFLNSVSCPSARFCLAGGSYSDRSGATQGLLLNLRLR
jgi:hypothetical protein